ncbi:isopentenyl-diphosphate delta-isomerase [Botrytis cinerea]
MSTTTTTTQAEPITAESILRLFPDIDTSSAELEGHDEEQIRLMDEVCIVLDENDKPIGNFSKKICHLMTNIDKGLLHRAFSVFLFNSKNELLLQQRATEKITFPDMWTNTCCSHPLGIPGEGGSELDEAIMESREQHKESSITNLASNLRRYPSRTLSFLTRIHYKAPSDGNGESMKVFDYILFITADVDLEPNMNEVRDTRYVSADGLKTMFTDPSLKFTPWFKLICNSLLFEWWEHKDTDLEKYMNEQDIRRM